MSPTSVAVGRLLTDSASLAGGDDNERSRGEASPTFFFCLSFFFLKKKSLQRRPFDASCNFIRTLRVNWQ